MKQSSKIYSYFIHQGFFFKTDDLETLAYTVQLMLILGTLTQKYQEILDLNVHPLKGQIETTSQDQFQGHLLWHLIYQLLKDN